MKKNFLIVLVGILCIILSGCGNTKVKNINNNTTTNEDGTLKQTVNTNEEVIKAQTISGILLNNISLININNSSILTFDATNNSKEDINIDYFKVYLKDENKKDMLVNPNYISAPVYKIIKVGETIKLIVNVDRNLDSVYSLSYEMVKSSKS